MLNSTLLDTLPSPLPFVEEKLASYLNALNSSFEPRKRLSGKLVTKLANTAATEWKDQAQKILYLYLKQVHSLSSVHEQKLKTLEEDFKMKSLYEVYTKYAARLAHTALDAEEDPLYLQILQLLLSEQGKEAVKQDMNQLHQRMTETQFQWAPVQRDEMLRLLIQAKRDKWAAQGLNFNCYVLDNTELECFLQLFEKQLKPKTELETQLFLLVRNEVHYTALGFTYRQGKKHCVILDASQDPKHHLLSQVVEKLGFEVVITGQTEEDKIQLDNRSCSLFAFGQLCHLAKDQQAFEGMKLHSSFDPSSRRLPWLALHPRLVKDAQDLQFLKLYVETYPDQPYQAGKSFASYLKERIDETRLAQTERNTGIEKRLSKYAKIVREKLQHSSTEELNRIACTHPFMAFNLP